MRALFSRAVTAVFGDRDVTPLAIKVPQITALFWAAKITSTAMGEALADFLDGGSGLVWPALGALLSLAAFIVAMRRQLRRREYDTATYWFAVAMVATFGTMAADSLHQFLGIPYAYTTLFYAIVLALVFWRWWHNEGTLSIHSIDSRRREHFYWGTVLSTFALGTATGDWTATSLHLGFSSSGLVFAGAIVIPLIAYKLGANPILTFWTAYVLTRPLGASFADWFDYPKKAQGLGVGTLRVWIVLAIVMLGIVSVIALRERRGHGLREAHSSDDAAHHPHLALTPELAAE